MVTSNNSPFVDVKTQTSLNKQGGGFTLPQRTLSEGDMKGAAAYYIMYCYKLLLFYNSQRVALKRFNCGAKRLCVSVPLIFSLH